MSDPTGLELKTAGMEAAAESQKEKLERARDAAVEIALSRDDRCCHMDLVREKVGDLGPAAGSLFKGPMWRFTGQRILSQLPANHAREIKVWQLSRIHKIQKRFPF
tara:strand:+ start:10012 stop:10329 length:318 start_codon:yes stop_codon:yes gene_type:complete